MLDLTVKVPVDRLAGFYVTYGSWMAGTDSPTAPAIEEPATELLDVTVKVTAERLADFHLMIGHWLAGASTPMPDAVKAPAGTPKPERTPWVAEDVDLAILVWDKLSDPAKALFSTMIDAPEGIFDGDQLADMLGLTTGRLGISGLLSWPSKHAAAAGRQIFWECLIGPDGPSGTCEYSMSQVQARLFQQARDRRR
jgi:Family of unknown function (DUF6416)